MIEFLPPSATLDDYYAHTPVASGGKHQVENFEGLDHGHTDMGKGRGEVSPGDCDCGGPPPPEFLLPPPPRPPPTLSPLAGNEIHDALEDDCEDALSCPVFLGAREDHRLPPTKAHLTVVVAAASALLVIVLVAAVVVCRLRGRGRSNKGCTELGGAIIYDDLSSTASIMPSRSRPRFKPVPFESDDSSSVGAHLYTPEPKSRPPSEHLYQSISSGSETCSCSTSEATASEGRALLRLHHHRRGLGGGGGGSGRGFRERGGGGGGGGGRRSPSLVYSDSEDERLASRGILVGVSDEDTPSGSPAHSSLYYCPSTPNPLLGRASSSSPRSSDYESVYYVGGVRRGMSPTPQERGLPPLPSRTNRFRMYFSMERGQEYHMVPLRRKRGEEGTMESSRSSHRRVTGQGARLPPEAEPLYENFT